MVGNRLLHTLNGDLQMRQNTNTSRSDSSSSESTDDEEARKIREAVCDESIYKPPRAVDLDTRKTNSDHSAKTGPHHHEGNQAPVLKSNRLQDKNDDKDDNILQTTPEFRAYVAKQLSSMLDSVLADSIEEGVWSVSQSPLAKTSSGIWLFSDSRRLCTSGDTPGEAETQPEKKERQRKHRLSTSSESSEDEKISACVYTVADICEENERLTALEKQTTAEEGKKNLLGLDKETESKRGHDTITSQSDRNVAKKRRKKKKKNKTEKGGIT